MGKSTISMVIFNRKLLVYQRIFRVEPIHQISSRFGWSPLRLARELTAASEGTLLGPGELGMAQLQPEYFIAIAMGYLSGDHKGDIL